MSPLPHTQKLTIICRNNNNRVPWENEFLGIVNAPHPPNKKKDDITAAETINEVHGAKITCGAQCFAVFCPTKTEHTCWGHPKEV